MRALYGPDGVNTVVDPDFGPEHDITKSSHYKYLIQDPIGYEFVFLHVHGTAGEHVFYQSSETGEAKREEGPGTFSTQEYRTITTNVNYFLFSSCATCQFGYDRDTRGHVVLPDFICGSALFGQVDGTEDVKTLGVVAPSTPAGFYIHEPFFRHLERGYTIGEALNAFAATPRSNKHTGLAFQLFGDPWLRVHDQRLCTGGLRIVLLRRFSDARVKGAKATLYKIGTGRQSRQVQVCATGVCEFRSLSVGRYRLHVIPPYPMKYEPVETEVEVRTGRVDELIVGLLPLTDPPR